MVAVRDRTGGDAGRADVTGKRLLLVIDEADLLGSKPEHENFVRSLRTLLDERRGKVCTLFCGSSQARMNDLFLRSKSPLFRFATQQEFTPLGDHFLEHWRMNIAGIMDAKNGQLTLEHMRAAFITTERNPRTLWSAVVEMIQHGSVDVVAYARKAADPRGEGSALADRMADLSALDRLLLRAIVAHAVARRDGQAPAPAPLELFSAAARARVKAAIGMTPTPTQIQGSLLRLADGETSLVTAQGSGVYEIDDPYTLAWLQEELLDDAPATRSEGFTLPVSTAGEDEITNDSEREFQRSSA